MFFSRSRKSRLPETGKALSGRADPIPTAEAHFVNGRPLKGPFPEGMEMAMFGMGCFWGVERIFWQIEGVWVSAVGYSAGQTSNPTYQEVCSGGTGHNEVVLVVFDPAIVSYSELLAAFWEGHNPTQGMRQGNDSGTQYRSGIYTFNEAQKSKAETTRQIYAEKLQSAGHGLVTTEVVDATEFYYAEDYHQQYLAKNPGGYCGLGGTGVTCPVGTRA